MGLLCSLPNHSCNPSAAVSAVWDAKAAAVQLRLYATRPLEAGDEVTISYVPSRFPPNLRRLHLTQRYGFACACERCEAAFPGAAAAVTTPGAPAVGAPVPAALTVAVDDTVVYTCKACAAGRVFGGGAACVDCGAAVPPASVGGGGGGGGGASATPPLLCSSPNGDWDRQRKAWLARGSARSLEDVIKGAHTRPRRRRVAPLARSVFVPAAPRRNSNSDFDLPPPPRAARPPPPPPPPPHTPTPPPLSAGADGCPLHPTDPSRLQLATSKLANAMKLPAGEAGSLAARLLPALLAQPRLADSGLLVNCAHLLALGGRTDEARGVYTTAAVRGEAEYGPAHPLPALYRALAAKPPSSAAELGKVEGKRRAGGDWVESAGLGKRVLQRWLEPVSFTAPLRQAPGGQAALGGADAGAMRELERAKQRVLSSAYAPGVDVWGVPVALT